MSKAKAILASLALTAAASAAFAAPVTIERTGAGSFPISSIVVVKGPGAASAGDTKAQTVDALTKIDTALKSKGFGLGDIVMMRVFLVADPATGKMDFMGMMGGYSQFFGTPAQPNKPARTTVQVAGLAAPGALVEIEAQAVKPVGAAIEPAVAH